MRDIILVTADSLRADYCGWQADTNLTPHLDRLASDSLQFTTAISPGPRTLSSIPVTHTGEPFSADSIDTSDYNSRVGRIRNHIERFETLPEMLQEEGYTTVGFTANPWTTEESGFTAGFDMFSEVGRTSSGTVRSWFEGTQLQMPARVVDRWVHKDTWFSQWRTFYEDVVETIQEIEGPVFAWVFLLDTHYPYFIPREDRDESSTYGMYYSLLRGRRNPNQRRADGDDPLMRDSLREKLISTYRDSISSVDKFVRRLQTTFGDDTIFIFHSDHGEAFGEHGTYGHMDELYEENIHVPLLVSGTENDGVVEDVVSTAEIPSIVQSCAQRGKIDPDEHTSEYAVSRTENSDKISFRGDRWKFIRTTTGDELYDLSTDPQETTDVSEHNPAIRSSWRETCDEYLDELPQSLSATTVAESESMKENLRDLGYLQD